MAYKDCIFTPGGESEIGFLCLSLAYKDCILAALYPTSMVRDFASAWPTKIASPDGSIETRHFSLCLSMAYKDCIFSGTIVIKHNISLPQHGLQRLHRQKC